MLSSDNRHPKSLIFLPIDDPDLFFSSSPTFKQDSKNLLHLHQVF
ncbi:hypothetical protein RDI58_009852 [Solanum bulbocastanum]|uniref:Uncharacterized protein n=1 Tax=Solanum bulbocastanum TaxID=147425 RepID=A0AAN8TSD6_SOLBU